MRQTPTYSNVRYIRRRQKNAAPVFGLWLFLLFCCLLASYFFMNSAFFSVQHINVIGNRVLAAEKVVELSGLNRGSNLFKLDTREAAEKIELHPSIKEVKIKRKLPHTIKIEITERIPAALVVGLSELIIVDVEGVYLQKVDDLQELQLPIISGIPVQENVSPGSIISTQGLNSALSLIRLMDRGFLVNIAEIIAATPESLALKTIQGVEIRFGKPEDIERKINLIQDLLWDNGAVINSQTIEYIDLRYNTTPVIKRKK